MEPHRYRWTQEELIEELQALLQDQDAQYAPRGASVIAQAIEELIELRELKKNIVQKSLA